MSKTTKLALSGTLLLFSLFMVMIASFYGAELATTTTTLPFGISILAFYLIPGLIVGFAGFYLFFSTQVSQ